MKPLNRKLLRELWANVGALFVVVVIIAFGAGSYVGMGAAQRVLETSQSAYYSAYRFADFWVDLKKAPLTEVERLGAIPGVEIVQSRVVFDVILDLPAQTRPINGRLISVPDRHDGAALNDIYLIRGAGFSDDRPEEVIVSDSFARTHHLNPGDRIHLILNRRREAFTIVGTCVSPEYVYMVRGAGDLIPDPQHFGVLYVKERYARDVLDFQDACNNVVGRFAAISASRREATLDEIERCLEPYGVFSAILRDQQASHRFLSDEIKGLRVSAVVTPVIFLAVSAMALSVLLRRLVERQRVTIGTLKALGYSNASLFRHFVWFGLFVGLVGGLAGCGVGLLLRQSLINVYQEFYHFPRYIVETHPDLMLHGVAISLVFSVLGALRGARRVLRLQPAESMRAKPPEKGSAILLERWRWLWRRLDFKTHLALRDVFRNKGRTISGVAATAIAGSIMIMTFSMFDAALFMVAFQFEYTNRGNVTIGMRDARDVDALYEGRDLPGVIYAEPTFGVVCDIRNGRYSRRQSIVGLASSHILTVPRDADLAPISIPAEGLVLSEKLASILHVSAGDSIEMKPIRGRPEPRRAFVAGIVDSFIGLDCYASLAYLSEVVGEPPSVNGIQAILDENERPAFFTAVKATPNAQGISLNRDAQKSIEGTFVRSLRFSLGIMILFAGVIGCGSLINLATVEIGDRTREISTFRVLGYQPREIAGIYLRQNAVLFGLGLLLAVPLGYALDVLMARAYDTELFRMPVVFRMKAIGWSLLISVFFIVIAQWVVLRKIRRLDWLEGVKVKE
ncbi:MAG TPA: FtsX-like permease family protein [Phycisphaerae bacterium]|nr:FtsX-like permease family protein [Phycisphaerae bacterium]HRW55383.1 FtsX-like permease family protein [Phycisphaerae bacterium]